MTNGYGTPGGYGSPHMAPAGGNPREAVNVPSILLMVAGGLGVMTALWSLVVPQNTAQLEQIISANPDLEQYRGLFETLSSGAARLINIIPLLVSGFVIFGGLKMRNLENRGMALAASIAALVPCFGPACCVCLPTGIAAGIWSLIVLSKPEVKAAFRT